MSRAWVVGLLVLAVPLMERAAAAPNPRPQAPASAAAVAPPSLEPPAPEISGDPPRGDLPAVPRFALPRLPDGLHSPQEVLVAGRALLGTRIRVAGYITWIYDCATALATRNKTRAQIQRAIEDDPSQCERPKLYLGDTRKTPADRALWVVQVPRRPFKIEKERLPAEELAHWPAVPRLTVGAYVVVTGTLALESPKHERNSDGLLVYEAIEFPRAPVSATLVASPPAALPPLPPIPPPVRSAAPAHADESMRHLVAGNRAYTNQQYDVANMEYEAAIRAWDGNHHAWYGLVAARAKRRDFAGAAAAAERCVLLVPDSAMYWLFRGRMLYEATLEDARKQEASRQGQPLDKVVINGARLDFTPAFQALLVALQLEDKLWRAHYFVGRIQRDRGEARPAAEQLTRAIALHADDPGPYIALTELYRRWQYRDEAVAIAELAATLTPTSSELWFEIGMAHDDRGDAGKAIDGFTRALDLRPDHAQARFQRGQAYFRKKDVAHARPDLEAFVELAKADGGHTFEVQQARTMLADMAR